MRAIRLCVISLRASAFDSGTWNCTPTEYVRKSLDVSRSYASLAGPAKGDVPNDTVAGTWQIKPSPGPSGMHRPPPRSVELKRLTSVVVEIERFVPDSPLTP